MGAGAAGDGEARLASRRTLLPDGRIVAATVMIAGPLIAAVGPYNPAGATDLGSGLPPRVVATLVVGTAAMEARPPFPRHLEPVPAGAT